MELKPVGARVVALACALLLVGASLLGGTPAVAKKRKPHRRAPRFLPVHMTVRPHSGGRRTTFTVRFRARQKFEYTVRMQRRGTGFFLNCSTGGDRAVRAHRVGKRYAVRLRPLRVDGGRWCVGHYRIQVLRITFGADPCAHAPADEICRDGPPEIDHRLAGAQVVVHR